MDDRRILDQYPLPIARCYRRYLNASQPRERHDHAYFLLEVYLKYSASIAIAGYLSREERDHRGELSPEGPGPPLARRVAGLPRILGAGQELRSPPREAAGPAFLSLYEAAEYYRALDAKADRLLPKATMATWSPGGEEIAYSGGWLGSNGLEVLDLRSGRTRLLTFPAKDLAWSRDGSVIAFVRDRKTWHLSFFTRERFKMVDALEADYERHEEVWTITPAGDGLRRIARGGYPSFGRDPKRVYFHSREEMAGSMTRKPNRNGSSSATPTTPSFRRMRGTSPMGWAPCSASSS